MHDKSTWDLNWAIANQLATNDGCAIIHVQGEGIEWPWTHTIGNQQFFLPELMAFGPPHWCEYSLKFVSDQIRVRRKPFDNGQKLVLPTERMIKIIDASPDVTESYTHQASAYYETRDYLVQQVLFADSEGRFAQDPDCVPAFKVPVLGYKKVLH